MNRPEQTPLSWEPSEKPPTPPTRPQGKKALAMLEAAKWRGVSGVDFVNNYLFAYSQECGRLERECHYSIVSRRDRDSKVFRYWLAKYFDPERV